MALRDFVYRCPVCGNGPMEGRGDVASCTRCARVYSAPDGWDRIRVRGQGGEVHFVSPGQVARRMDDLEEEAARSTVDDRPFRHEASVTVRRSPRELPVRHRGETCGFVERFGRKRPGRLILMSEELEFHPRNGPVQRWLLRDLRAVQGSSSSLQIYVLTGELISLRFAEESPRWWEELVKARLRAVWRREGRGEIVEFQPRIRGDR